MKCPYCEKEMQEGELTGDGRSKVRWISKGRKLGVIDKLAGKGEIDADYSAASFSFSIKANYCVNCGKMIFDTKISN